MTVALTNNFLSNTRALIFEDGGGITWSFNPSTNQLSANGSGAGASGANPAATVGLTAVNGSAATFMRSDGAPALSQAIAPVWTSLHTFRGGLTIDGHGSNAVLTLTGVNPYSSLVNFGAAGGGQAALQVNGSNVLLITEALSATFESTFAINGGTPIAQPTGYGSPSGAVTSNLSSSSTLAEVAGTLAALLAYLKTIGFIGA